MDRLKLEVGKPANRPALASDKAETRPVVMRVDLNSVTEG